MVTAARPFLREHSKLGDLPDEELVARLRTRRDPAAFEALVQRYEQELFGFLRRYLGNADLADDVFQETFLRVHTKCDSFEPGRAFRPWLYSIATNQAIDALRRARRHRPRSDERNGAERTGAVVETIPSRERPVEEQCEAAEVEAWVRSAVDRLSDPQRRVVTLFFRRGAKQSEIASLLGIPVGTVKSRLHTALHNLHAAWHRADRRLAVGEIGST